ncbi:hypothetical protein [Pseudalkalibacillus sp. SCS-8]|uniref:hypothetical protein n=1 Tax=Pseudalkalibacillus nanhaiensis TaxID=3115291 RepID=UPI0032DB1D47
MNGTTGEEIHVRHKDELLAYTHHVLRGTPEQIRQSKHELFKEVGTEGLLSAAAIIAFFNAINRVADATGTALDTKVKNSEFYRQVLIKER